MWQLAKTANLGRAKNRRLWSADSLAWCLIRLREVPSAILKQLHRSAAGQRFPASGPSARRAYLQRPMAAGAPGRRTPPSRRTRGASTSAPASRWNACCTRCRWRSATTRRAPTPATWDTWSRSRTCRSRDWRPAGPRRWCGGRIPQSDKCLISSHLLSLQSPFRITDSVTLWYLRWHCALSSSEQKQLV